MRLRAISLVVSACGYGPAICVHIIVGGQTLSDEEDAKARICLGCSAWGGDHTPVLFRDAFHPTQPDLGQAMQVYITSLADGWIST